MSDRATLAAALGYADAGMIGLAPLETMYAAARERLAQLPEKCEHGRSEPHRVYGRHHWNCPGRRYSPELVARLSAALLLRPGNTQQLALYFLDALNDSGPDGASSETLHELSDPSLPARNTAFDRETP